MDTVRSSEHDCMVSQPRRPQSRFNGIQDRVQWQDFEMTVPNKPLGSADGISQSSEYCALKEDPGSWYWFLQ
jgi:hypothetical protein